MTITCSRPIWYCRKQLVEGRAFDTKHAVYTIQKNRMIYGVEGGGQIGHDEDHSTFVVKGMQDVILYFYERCLRAVVGPIRRLKLFVQRVLDIWSLMRLVTTFSIIFEINGMSDTGR